MSFPIGPRWIAYVAPEPAKEWLKNAKWPFFEWKWIYRVKINAFNFLAPTTFGAEYCLTHDITNHLPKTDLPCSVVSLRQLSYLYTLLKYSLSYSPSIRVINYSYSTSLLLSHMNAMCHWALSPLIRRADLCTCFVSRRARRGLVHYSTHRYDNYCSLNCDGAGVVTRAALSSRLLYSSTQSITLPSRPTGV